MPVPKKKTTKSAKNQRRSHHALKKPVLSKCPNCKKPIVPHYVCSYCGYYKGKQVIEIKTKEDKKLQKKKQAVEKKNKKGNKEEKPTTNQ